MAGVGGDKAEGKLLHSARLLFQFAKLVCWRRATMTGDSKARAYAHSNLFI